MGPPWEEKLNWAGARRGTELAFRKRAAVSTAVEHFIKLPPSVPLTKTLGSKWEKERDVTPTTVSPRECWGRGAEGETKKVCITAAKTQH